MIKPCMLHKQVANLRGLALVSLASALLTLGAGPAAAAQYTMKLGTPTPRGNQNEWMARFKERVEKRAGKDVIEIKLFPSSQLGAIPRAIEGLQFGTIEGYVLPPGFLKGIDPNFQVLDTPGLMDSEEHAKRTFADAKFRNLFFKAGEGNGVKLISLYASAMASVVTRDRPIRRLEDYKGQKLRVLASDMESEEFKRLGAAPVPMPLGEVLPALQRGALDGVKSALVVFIPFKYWTTAKYLTESGESVVPVGAFVSKRWFDGLPANLRSVLLEEGKKLESEMADYSFDFNKRFRGIWTKNGGELIRFDAKEQKRFISKIKTVGASVSKKNPKMKPLYDALLDSANRNR